MLSRLKGIETKRKVLHTYTPVSHSGCYMLSRLKGIETKTEECFEKHLGHCLPVPSRLKGMFWGCQSLTENR